MPLFSPHLCPRCYPLPKAKPYSPSFHLTRAVKSSYNLGKKWPTILF